MRRSLRLRIASLRQTVRPRTSNSCSMALDRAEPCRAAQNDPMGTRRSVVRTDWSVVLSAVFTQRQNYTVVSGRLRRQADPRRDREVVRRVAPALAGAHDGGGEHLGARLHQHVVDLLARRLPEDEAGERADLLLVAMHRAEGVDERRGGAPAAGTAAGPAGPTRTCRAGFDSPALKSPVTMTGSDGIGPRRDALQQQRRALLAGRLRLVIEVQVVVGEGGAVAIDEAGPRCDARDAVAPRLRAGDLRRVREPERAARRHVEARGADRIADISPAALPSSRPTPTTA